MDQIEDGSIQITADDFPAFVYESGTVYDEDNEDVGLFRGYLLIRASTCIFIAMITDYAFMMWQVYRHIFTGPSSALNPTSKGPHKTKAKKFKLTEVTPRTIAYASVQVSCLQANIDSLLIRP